MLFKLPYIGELLHQIRLTGFDAAGNLRVAMPAEAMQIKWKNELSLRKGGKLTRKVSIDQAAAMVDNMVVGAVGAVGAQGKRVGGGGKAFAEQVGDGGKAIVGGGKAIVGHVVGAGGKLMEESGKLMGSLVPGGSSKDLV